MQRGLARQRDMPMAEGLNLHIVAPPATMADPVALHLASRHGRVRAILPQRVLRNLLATLDPAAPDAGPDWTALLLELAVENWLGRLEAWSPSLACTIALDDLAAPPEPLALGLALGEVVLRLEFGPPVAQAILSVLAAVPDGRRALPGLTFALHLRALATTVPLGEWRSTRAGDVVLADGLADGDVLLVAGEIFAWRGRREAGRLTVTTPRRRAQAMGLGEWVMQDDGADAGEPDGGLDELPVRLTFELGRMELTLAELQAIGPGHVFELARAEEEAVDIVANGRRIGRGRIVSVAGALGVQIVRIGAG